MINNKDFLLGIAAGVISGYILGMVFNWIDSGSNNKAPELPKNIEPSIEQRDMKFVTKLDSIRSEVLIIKNIVENNQNTIIINGNRVKFKDIKDFLKK